MQIGVFPGHSRRTASPSCGADGYIDMAIIDALYRSAPTGVPQDVKLIPSF